MALPKIDLPTFKLFLKSIEKEITFRPFVVKEEKILLLALETEDMDAILEAVKQVINNCILTEDIDVDSLPLFEIEFIFLNIRARSMGEIINVTYICGNELEDKKCPAEMEVEVDVLKAAVEMTAQNSTVMISDKVGIKFKYPTLEVTKILNSEDLPEMETTVKLIELCTDYLFDDEQVYKPADMQPGEFDEFISNLTQDQFVQMQNFFDNIPKIKYDTKVTCGACGKEHDIHLEGMLDFFE